MPVSKEDAVRELAYRLWAARGRQQGFDLQDWLDAERLIGCSEDNADPPIGCLSRPRTKSTT